MCATKFSIITPTLNRASMLGSAILSVLDQHYADCEHLVVDGGSTDGTAELVTKYPQVRFITGRDGGMYDALNKGLRASQGDIIGFLNSDDRYGGHVFQLVADCFHNQGVQAVVGKAIIFADGNGNAPRIISEYSPSAVNILECATMGATYFNAWFFRRSLVEQLGAFDTRYRIVGDRDFMLRFTARSPKYEIVDAVVYEYRWHPDSLTFTNVLHNRTNTVDELVGMIDDYLKSRKLPDTTLAMLRAKRRQVTSEMAIRYLKARDLRRAVSYALIGSRNDLSWAATFGRALLEKRAAR